MTSNIWPQRRSIRMRGFNYASNNMYYVTICTRRSMELFGDVIDGVMHLSPAGEMIEREWLAIGVRYPNISVDEFVVMPNHLHGILIFHKSGENSIGGQARIGGHPQGAPVRAGLVPARSLGSIIGAFKSRTTLEYIHGVKNSGWTPFPRCLWHRNYYEHIVRDAEDLARIRKYIRDNPANWTKDRLKIENLES